MCRSHIGSYPVLADGGRRSLQLRSGRTGCIFIPCDGYISVTIPSHRRSRDRNTVECFREVLCDGDIARGGINDRGIILFPGGGSRTLNADGYGRRTGICSGRNARGEASAHAIGDKIPRQCSADRNEIMHRTVEGHITRNRRDTVDRPQAVYRKRGFHRREVSVPVDKCISRTFGYGRSDCGLTV